jgi:SAM-dependent methyltransferase|tara:strand:- start:1847 stop:2587 length:741 start_codon:yes stop_codon:yes gene_type:complete
MRVPDYIASYKSHLANLIEKHGREEAMQLIVGGEYDQIGKLERSALIDLGLKRNHSLVDIGCGSGRLPFALRDYLEGPFVGTDILEEALGYANDKCGRPDWRFVPTSEPSIPLSEATVDFVTFFSVFTHLLDEDIYRFLLEAKRVLRPGGKIVFSFLDFECDRHWHIFEATVADQNPLRVINKFISHGAIRRWARALDLKVEVIYDGSAPWVNLDEPFNYTDGRRAEGVVEFGQSVAVLRKCGLNE